MGCEDDALLSPREYHWLKIALGIIATFLYLLYFLGLTIGFYSSADSYWHENPSTLILKTFLAITLCLCPSLLTLFGAATGSRRPMRKRLVWLGLLMGLLFNIYQIIKLRQEYRILWGHAEAFGPGVKSAMFFLGTTSGPWQIIIMFLLLEIPLIYVSVAMLLRGRRQVVFNGTVAHG